MTDKEKLEHVLKAAKESAKNMSQGHVIPLMSVLSKIHENAFLDGFKYALRVLNNKDEN